MDRLISEQAILQAIKEPIKKMNCRKSNTELLKNVEQAIKAIPSVEPSRDMEEIEEVINCDADAETKCKMISNILTAKPHYFEKQEPCDDAISRQTVKEQMIKYGFHAPDMTVTEFVEDLLPIKLKEPKTGQYEKHIDHTDCIWYGSDSGCPVTCSQYRDGWNDAMDYIFKNGKGYQPYRHDGLYER